MTGLEKQVALETVREGLKATEDKLESYKWFLGALQDRRVSAQGIVNWVIRNKYIMVHEQPRLAEMIKNDTWRTKEFRDLVLATISAVIPKYEELVPILRDKVAEFEGMLTEFEGMVAEQ